MTPSKVHTTSNKSIKVLKRALIGLGIVLVLLVIGFILFGLNYKSETLRVWDRAFDSVNFSFTPPSTILWTPVATTSITLPPDLGTPVIAFKRNNSPCVLAYVDTSAAWKDWQYVQSSFAGSVPFDEDDGTKGQIDFDYLLNKKDNPPEIDSKKYFARTRIPYPKEVMVGFYYPSNILKWNGHRFVLYEENGGIIPAKCSQEVADMLTTVREKYSTIKLNPESEGYLYAKSEGLMFLPTQENISYKVWGGSFTGTAIVKDNLIFGVSEGRLISYNPFSNEERQLSERDQITGTVTDLLLVENSIYFLSVSDAGCLDSPTITDCKSKLYRYDKSTQTLSLINDALQASRLIGTNSERTALYLASRWADAGEVWAMYWKYSLLTNTQDEGTDALPDGYLSGEEISQKFDVLYVNNNKLLPPLGDIPNRQSTYQLFSF